VRTTRSPLFDVRTAFAWFTRWCLQQPKTSAEQSVCGVETKGISHTHTTTHDTLTRRHTTHTTRHSHDTHTLHPTNTTHTTLTHTTRTHTTHTHYTRQTRRHKKLHTSSSELRKVVKIKNGCVIYLFASTTFPIFWLCQQIHHVVAEPPISKTSSNKVFSDPHRH
jgi:hypothetical protein